MLLSLTLSINFEDNIHQSCPEDIEEATTTIITIILIIIAQDRPQSIEASFIIITASAVLECMGTEVEDIIQEEEETEEESWEEPEQKPSSTELPHTHLRPHLKTASFPFPATTCQQ